MTTTTLRPNAALVLAAGFVVLFVGGGARFVVGLNFKPMVDELGWLRSDLGLAVFVFQVVSATATFWAGKLADRISLRTLLLSGLLISGAGIGLMAIVTVPWHAILFYGVIFAVGTGMSSVSPVGVMVTRVYPGRAGFANGVAVSGMSAGQFFIIAGLAGVLVLIGWRSVYVWAAVAFVVLVPLLYPLIPPDKGNSTTGMAPATGMSLRDAARTRQFWILLAVFLLCGIDDFFVTTHVAAFAQDRGMDVFFAGNLLAAMGLTGLIGVIGAGMLADRAGPRSPVAWSFVARIFAFGLIALDQSAVSIAIFTIVFGLTFMVTAPLTILFVRDAFGLRNLGAIAGLITMVHQVGGGLGAYLGSILFDARGSYDLAFVTMLVVSMVALGLTMMLKRMPMRA